MREPHCKWKLGMVILMAGAAAIGDRGRALAWQDPADGADSAADQVQTRGPVHEAFAEPVVFDPAPGPVVPKEPAPPVEEQPPDQKPDGDDVQWIVGYWGWDEDRSDFLWVSGIWRLPPPGRQWTPGYWNQVDGGWQWTHGVWTPVDEADATYLPTPPASIEAGPNCDPPADDSIWSPGCWFWSESRYVWRPGCWVAHRPDWNWVPPHYASTPRGSLFVEGYWDYPVEERGVLYAPVYLSRLRVSRPGFVYCPSVCIPEAALVSSLFVQPSCNQYCFGDYYDANNFRAGIYPWYSFHQSRYGYDPIYSFYSATHCRDRGWAAGIHEEYRYRRENPFARPPHTLAEQAAYQQRRAGKFRNLAMTTSISHLTDHHHRPLPIEKLRADRRSELAQQGKQVHQIGQTRAVHEPAAAKGFAGKGHQVTTLKLPSSPIGARMPSDHTTAATAKTGQHFLNSLHPSSWMSPNSTSRTGASAGRTPQGSVPPAQRPQSHPSSRRAPPALPTHPGLDHSAKHPQSGHVPQLPDPHPNLPAFEHRSAGHPKYGSKNAAANNQQRTPAQSGRPASRTSIPTRSH